MGNGRREGGSRGWADDVGVVGPLGWRRRGRRRLAEAPLRGGRACDRDGHATGGGREVLELVVFPVGGGRHVHDAGEGPGEGSVFVVAEAFGDLADGEGCIEEAVAGGGDFGVEDEAFGGSAQVAAEAAFEGADGHVGFVGQFVDAEGFVDVAVDEVDEFGEGAVGGGEGVALALGEAAGDAGGADDVVLVVPEGNFGGHAPLDAAGPAGDELHLVHEGFAFFPEAEVIPEEDLGDFGREDIGVCFADNFLVGPVDEFAEGEVDVNEVTLAVLDPEEDIRNGLEEGEGDLARAQGMHKFREVPKLILQTRRGIGNERHVADFR